MWYFLVIFLVVKFIGMYVLGNFFNRFGCGLGFYLFMGIRVMDFMLFVIIMLVVFIMMCFVVMVIVWRLLE